jgi:hypothetical protein
MTIRFFKYLALILSLTTCKTEQTNQDRFDSNSGDFTGVWQFSSSTLDYIKGNYQILILEDSTYCIFYGNNGGELIEKGSLSKDDSLIDERNLKYGVTRFDSITIQIENHHSFNGDFINTYRKTRHDPSDKLVEYQSIDSMRNNTIGWWVLTKSTMPFDPINHSGEYESFTMQINKDGSAAFYLNNYLDSAVDYSYSIRKNGIEFRKSDAFRQLEIWFESDSVMRMIWDPRDLDTLTLKKLRKIKTTGNNA